MTPKEVEYRTLPLQGLPFRKEKNVFSSDEGLVASNDDLGLMCPMTLGAQKVRESKHQDYREHELPLVVKLKDGPSTVVRVRESGKVCHQ